MLSQWQASARSALRCPASAGDAQSSMFRGCGICSGLTRAQSGRCPIKSADRRQPPRPAAARGLAPVHEDAGGAVVHAGRNHHRDVEDLVAVPDHVKRARPPTLRDSGRVQRGAGLCKVGEWWGVQRGLGEVWVRCAVNLGPGHPAAELLDRRCPLGMRTSQHPMLMHTGTPRNITRPAFQDVKGATPLSQPSQQTPTQTTLPGR